MGQTHSTRMLKNTAYASLAKLSDDATAKEQRKFKCKLLAEQVRLQRALGALLEQGMYRPLLRLYLRCACTGLAIKPGA